MADHKTTKLLSLMRKEEEKKNYFVLPLLPPYLTPRFYDQTYIFPMSFAFCIPKRMLYVE